MRTVDGMEITGKVYLTVGTRTLDLLNRGTETFIAMTDCSISMGGQLESAPFIAVNKAHIATLREVARPPAALGNAVG